MITVPPTPPLDVKLVTTTPGSVTLKWEPSALNGGDDIQGYYVERTLAGIEEWVRCNVVPYKGFTGEVNTEMYYYSK